MIPIGNLALGHLLLLDQGLPHVLVLSAILVNLFGWMGQGKTFLLLPLYYKGTSFLKVITGGGW